MTENPNLLKVGYIISFFGLKGSLKAKFLKNWTPEKLDKIYLEKENDFLGPFNIISEKRIKGFWLINLKGINSIKEAKKYIGYSIGVNFPELPENTFWIDDIIGCSVFEIDGGYIGKIMDVLSTGANDVYVLNTEKGKEELLPALKSIIIRVDINDKIITIKAPDGLFLKDEN